MADPITWPVAFTIVGGMSVAAIAVAGFIAQSFKRETPWKDPISKLTTTVVKLETQVTQISDKMDDTQRIIQEQENRNERDFDRIYERLEKVTDLMIDMIRDDPSSATSKKEK